jgi:hypothetical protein
MLRFSSVLAPTKKTDVLYSLYSPLDGYPGILPLNNHFSRHKTCENFRNCSQPAHQILIRIFGIKNTPQRSEHSLTSFFISKASPYPCDRRWRVRRAYALPSKFGVKHPPPRVHADTPPGSHLHLHPAVPSLYRRPIDIDYATHLVYTPPRRNCNISTLTVCGCGCHRIVLLILKQRYQLRVQYISA